MVDELQSLVVAADVADAESLIRSMIVAELKPRMIASAQQTLSLPEARSIVGKYVTRVLVTQNKR